MFSSIREYWVPILIFLISILFTYNYIDFNSNMSVGTGHVYVAKSIALSRDFNVNEYWGNAGADIIKVNGNYYVPYAPFNAVLMAIPYFILQVLYFIFVNLGGTINGEISLIFESISFSLPSSLSLFGILFLVSNYIKLKVIKLNSVQKILLLVGIGLGTILFTYSVSYFNHIIAAFFIFASFYFATKTKLESRYFIAGVFTGLSFLAEFPTILFSIAFFFAELDLFMRKKKSFKSIFVDLSVYALPIFICLVLLGVFNYIHFDNPFITGEQAFNIHRQQEGRRHFSFSQNPILGLYGSLFSPLKGIFFYSPFLIFSFIGVRSLFKKARYDFVLLISYLIIIIFTYSMWNDCFGATVFGDRYLVSTIPFWAVLLASSYNVFWGNLKLRALYFILVVYSVASILLNSFVGIATGRYSQCELYLNTYTPLHRIYDSYRIKEDVKVSPVILKLGFN